MKNSKLVSSILDNFFEGYTLDANGKLQVVNEGAAKKASEALSKLVLEQAREWWDQLESAETSLSDIADEITFQELNADPSSAPLDVKASASGEPAPAAAPADAGIPGDVLPESADDLKSLFGSDDFDFKSIFEGMDNFGDEEVMMDAEGDMEDEEDVVDGDEDFNDLKMGMDDAEMGADDDMVSDDGDDSLGGDDLGDDFGGDDLGDDGEMDFGDDTETLDGDDDGLEFDFDFLSDEGDDLGDPSDPSMDGMDDGDLDDVSSDDDSEDDDEIESIG